MLFVGGAILCISVVNLSCCLWTHVHFERCFHKDACEATVSTENQVILSAALPALTARDGHFSVAVVVTGTTGRFLLNSTIEHVLRPLAQIGLHDVDYYALLTETQGRAYRQDLEYMNHIVGDPLFHGKNISKVTIDAIVESGASVGAFIILPVAVAMDSEELAQKRKDATMKYPEENADLRFPTLDLRTKVQQRSVAGNLNMLKLFNNQEYLWDTELVAAEASRGKKYDYVMILRDDTHWLQDFDLSKLVETNPDADAYIQSCDFRTPRMLPQEINDHRIVMKREKAEVIGRYLSSLLSADLDACHRNSNLGPQRGCNSEMALKWILQENNVTVQLVPQSLLPSQRSMVVSQNDGTMQYCLHKFCQSQEAPLPIPEGMLPCKEVVFK